MDEKDIEKDLNTIRESMQINQVLKKSLRKEFEGIKSRNKLYKIISLAGVAAALIIAIIFNSFSPVAPNERVSAAALKVSNYVSFIELGNGGNLGVSENNGTIYMPVFGKGLFSYNQYGFNQLSYKDVNFVRVSPDGRNLVFSSTGSIYIYNIENKSETEIIKGNDTTYYEEPSWYQDGTKIIYTKKVIVMKEPHGYDVKESGIYEYNLSTKLTAMLAQGSYANFVVRKNSIVFERDNKVILKDLAKGTEAIIDNGRFPSVSPNGNYITYVKNEQTKKYSKNNASVIENIDNVWIADMDDISVKKKVTDNFPNHYTDPQKWLTENNNSTLPVVLNISGRYSYYNPVWGSNNLSIYTLKNSNGAESSNGMRLIKIDFSTQKLSADETTKRFIQALIDRNEDYGKSLMKNPTEVLTISNPHTVGYKINGSGSENNKLYIDADVYLAYTANPNYLIESNRYYISPTNSGYIIDKIKAINSTDIFGRDNVIYLSKDSNQVKLFSISDIPKEFKVTNKDRFASLSYNKESNKLIFSVVSNGNNSTVKVFKYDLNNKNFKILEDIESDFEGRKGVGISNLLASSDGKYAAADLFSLNPENYRGYTYLYNTENGEKTDIMALFGNEHIDSVTTNYWDENVLVIRASTYGETTKYIYDTLTRKLDSVR